MATAYIGPVTSYDPRSAIGPTSDLLSNGFFDGYNPPSRNGEQVVNCFVDASEWNNVVRTESTKWRYETTPTDPPWQKQRSDHAKNFNTGGAGINPSFTQMIQDQEPSFEDWASVVPGTVAVQARDKTNFYKNSIAAQTSIPVLACAQKKGTFDNYRYRFAGVVRTRSIRKPTSDFGPKDDDHFTLTIGGDVQMLNNGNGHIYCGDSLEWTFFDDQNLATRKLPVKSKLGPRMIVIRTATQTSARIFGRALSSAAPGDFVDVLVNS